MGYMPVTELKKSRELWARLENEREIIVTKDGQPHAIIVGIEPDQVEVALDTIRRALFSTTVERVRDRARSLPDPEKSVDAAVRESRATRRR
jgi:antitoxin (DNA-binding transcriptional repressor) of toxin-antitoxin stability system